MAYAMYYTMNNPLMLETDYPYVARKETCKYDEA